MTTRATGYYCIVQFTPDRRRAEGANIGVLLFAPEHQFLDVRLASSNRRIHRFFGTPRGFDEEQVSAIRLSLKNRLRVEAEYIRSPEDLDHFVKTLANHLVLTPPRPVIVSDPARDLDNLFEELVAEPEESTMKQGPEVPIYTPEVAPGTAAQLAALLEEQGKQS
jgi:hypothetical protein